MRLPLRRLDLSKNVLDDKAVLLLIALFERTAATLEEARLEGNRFTREGKKELAVAAVGVENERVGRGLRLLL